MEVTRFTLIAKSLGFRVQEPQRQQSQWYIDLQQFSPQGEDWQVTVCFKSPNDIEKYIESLYIDFDVDEEVELRINHRGERGVASSIKNLVDDQEWKESKLKVLAEKLQHSPLEETMANRLIKSIKEKRFAFERYTGNGRLWNYQPIRVEPVFCSYGQIGWQVYAHDQEFCEYDYELEKITIN